MSASPPPLLGRGVYLLFFPLFLDIFAFFLKVLTTISKVAGRGPVLSIREPPVCQAVSPHEGAVQFTWARSKWSQCSVARSHPQQAVEQMTSPLLSELLGAFPAPLLNPLPPSQKHCSQVTPVFSVPCHLSFSLVFFSLKENIAFFGQVFRFLNGHWL